MAPRDTPKRGLHSLTCTTEIVKRFDVVAIQEAQKSLRALRQMLGALDRSWSVVLTTPPNMPSATTSATVSNID